MSKSSTRRRVATGAALAATLGLSAAACGGTTTPSSSGGTAAKTGANSPTSILNATSSSLAGGADITGKTVLWDWQSIPSNTFGVPMLNGAKAAAAITGLTLDVEYGNNSDTTEASQINTAVAKKEAGFLVGVGDAGLNSALCNAHATGAPVVTFNINGSSGSGASCVDSFVGQSFVSAGETIATYMVSNGLIKSGDKVFCPVETPGQTYAQQRRQGVDNVLGKLGITCDEVGTGDDLSGAKATLVQYLLGHHDTKAIIALGGTPLAESEASMKQAGLKIPIGGFDLSFPEIVSGLQDGAIAASVNQEPYAQGFYGVMELALDLKYGIPPENINTSDNALITKANVGAFSSLVPNYQ